ncbi:MAG TPA: tetratricopeptide repeat protein [Candidatus Acidoferrum sp.]|nr:tetratricopeptide repeat protein [Candidatus Acidoferrum sp.]
MVIPSSKYFLIPAIAGALILPASLSARSPQGPPDPAVGADAVAMAYGSANAEIYVKGPNGEALKGAAVVTLFRVGGELFNQGTAQGGFVKFDRMPYSEFIVQVVAPGYETAKKDFEVNGPGAVSVTLNLKALDAETAAASMNFYSLPRKVQKDVGKAMEALRANKLNSALPHLEAAERNAPNTAEIEYLFGVYESQANDPAKAMTHWMKTLQLQPNHLNALIAVGQDLLHETKPGDAETYLKRATLTAPTSWRAHAFLAEAYEMQNSHGDAITESRRALELGHDQAAMIQVVLARALAESGERQEAITVLEPYVKAHPGDTSASKDLAMFKDPNITITSNGTAIGKTEMADLTKEAAALPVPANWLPPDVDASIPPVEQGVSCNVDDVVRKAGEQLNELVKNVDRFTATETLVHESIDKYGMPSSPDKRIFSYVASIEEVNHHFLNVEEYRLDKDGGPAEFPGGVATNGLPALVLIFHPFNAPDFTMTCEGLARLSTGLAWQVHFKQRPDKPNVIKRYRIGADGPSYPVALKGRAWISADTFEIVRMETNLVAPIKEIRLAADRADIEYGPVKFAKGNVTMWLPKTADVYYDWQGRRIHRRHSFSDYMLFAVDDKQKISAPKTADAAPDNSQSKAPNNNH